MSESLIQPLDPGLDPVDACQRFLDLPHCVLLESAARTSDRVGRFSFLTADPFLVLRAKGSAVERMGPNGTERFEGDPFDALRSTLSDYAAETVPGLPPFQGGAVGYLGYELGRQIEHVPAAAHDDLGLPDLWIGLYDWTIAWDHGDGRPWLVSRGLPAAGEQRRRRAAERADAVRRRLDRPAPPIPRAEGAVRADGTPRAAGSASHAAGPPTHATGIPGVASTFSHDGYLELVARTREYILAGDIFQANLSQRLETALTGDPFALYRRLRQRNAAPFAAYLDVGGDATVVSASPERFLRLEGRRVETRPIKGTAARGVNPMHDLALAGALQASEKDRAENVMIVDLLRNDLSIVCRDHSVVASDLCRNEPFATVHHLVSTVIGELHPDRDAIDLLRAAFPGGSITGAPKIRAMEIIAELEPTQRSVYTGAIGYVGFDGTMDTSIAIRTIVATGDRAFFHAGGGIVADSDPEREYRETLDKARGLLAGLEDEIDPAAR